MGLFEDMKNNQEEATVVAFRVTKSELDKLELGETIIKMSKGHKFELKLVRG